MRIYELRQKEVINVCSGQKLGYATDVEFSLEHGCIEAIIVPGPCKLWGILGRDQEYVIPFKCICNIGTDVILVEIKEDDCLKAGKYV